ncbi:MAG: hypothetical protein JJE30_08940 [Desulfuromonadales bacterium]|nr:hypothetical protein [Desulfuromonadales bacterium]
MAESSEEEKYTRKAALLKKALVDADQMDAADAEKAKKPAATGKQKKETAAL